MCEAEWELDTVSDLRAGDLLIFARVTAMVFPFSGDGGGVSLVVLGALDDINQKNKSAWLDLNRKLDAVGVSQYSRFGPLLEVRRPKNVSQLNYKAVPLVWRRPEPKPEPKVEVKIGGQTITLPEKIVAAIRKAVADQ